MPGRRSLGETAVSSMVAARSGQPSAAKNREYRSFFKMFLATWFDGFGVQKSGSVKCFFVYLRDSLAYGDLSGVTNFKASRP